MNSNTKDKLEKFADAVIQLAAGSLHMIGVQSAGEIMTACEDLKRALESDETITEVR